jgi:hypothetical protein
VYRDVQEWKNSNNQDSGGYLVAFVNKTWRDLIPGARRQGGSSSLAGYIKY